MKKVLIISIVFNIFFIVFGGYHIHKRGGIKYLKNKFNEQSESQIPVKQIYDGYYYEKKSIFEIMPNDSNEIIFLGNSIIDDCEWSELFGNKKIKNRGIRGDYIKGIIDRIDEIVESNPKKIFLMIGINDLASNRTVKQILFDSENLINLIKIKSPLTDIYIHSIIPTDNRISKKNDDIIRINEGLMNIAKKNKLIYINLFDLFKNDENKLDTTFTYDGLHLNGKAYLLWKKEIENHIKLIKAK